MSNFLTINELQRKAPSIFTQGCSERTSDKYQPISTATIIENLRQEGFMPTSARQSNCRLRAPDPVNLIFNSISSDI